MIDEQTTNSIRYRDTKQYDLIRTRQKRKWSLLIAEVFVKTKTKKNCEPAKSLKMMMTNNNVFFSRKQTIVINILSKNYSIT